MGLILQDWPVIIAEGQITHYIGDVLAGVVAESDRIGREAIDLIELEYEILKPVTDVFKAISGNQVHTERPI